MSVNFDETQSVTQELTKVYQNLDDEESISQLQKQRADIQRAQEKKETEQKKLIKDFVNKVAQLDQDVARLKEEPVILRGRIENFEKQREALLLNFSNMDRESSTLKEKLESLQREIDALKKRKQEIEAVKIDDGPRLKMYQTISNIKWDYDSTNIKGSSVRSSPPITSLTGIDADIFDFENKIVKDVKPFDFDPKKYTQFQICNQLWDMITEA